MDTKRKGDVAEQAVILKALQQNWNVLKPIGDRLPYDLVFEINKVFVRVQVKSAWFSDSDDAFLVDNRRTQTNRRIMKRSKYESDDFDFAIVFIEDLFVFYILPIDVFTSYASSICFVESDKRQRQPRTASFRESWNLISLWAAQKETFV